MNLPQFILRLSPRSTPKICHSRSGEFKTGRIYHRFFSKQASSCIQEKCAVNVDECLMLLCDETRHRNRQKNIVLKLALTNFFDLSNIRAFAGGPVKMFGASRCLQKTPFQFDGQPALGADLPFECDFSTHFLFQTKHFSRHQAAWRSLRTSCAELCSFCVLSQNGGARL